MRFARRRAVGLAAAAVVIVAIISASAVAIFWIGVSSRASSAPTVTVTVTKTLSSAVSGISESQQSSSQSGPGTVEVTDVTAPAADFATKGRTTSFTCNLIALSGAYLVLTSTETQPATLSGLTIFWEGANNAFSPPPEGCQVGPAASSTATLYINLPNPATLSVAAVPGQTFNGTVTFSDNPAAPFTGTFQ